jgi:transitional endoplasmic reticulum ATPase
LKGVLVLGATNRLDMMDPAVLRPGRFDQIVEITLADETDRQEIFAVHLRGKPLAKGVNAKRAAALSDGLSGAEIASVCNQAALAAVRRAVAAELAQEGAGSAQVLILPADLEEALKEMLGGQEA